MDSAGRVTALRYDAENRLASIVDPGAREYLICYGDDGRLSNAGLNSGGRTCANLASTPETPVWGFGYHAQANPGAGVSAGLLAGVHTPRGLADGYSHRFEYYRDGR